MRAGLHNFTIQQGSQWSKPIVWADEDDVPVDITDWSARMHIRRRASDDTAIAELASPDQITVGTTDGAVTLALTTAATAALPAIEGVYDLEMVDPSGEATRILEGKMHITSEVTR